MRLPTVNRYRSKWPTIRGENPPQGIPYRCWEVWWRGRAIQVRLWRWR